MSRTFSILITIFTLSICYCAVPSLDEMRTRVKTTAATKTDDLKYEMDLMSVMMECNDTFRVEMGYIESLNTTGSFPDETDKTPKCYLRCVLEKLDILSSDGKFDTERVATIFAGERNGVSMEGIKEMADTCSDRRESCKCEKSYNFLKCLFTSEIDKYESMSSQKQ